MHSCYVVGTLDPNGQLVQVMLASQPPWQFSYHPKYHCLVEVFPSFTGRTYQEARDRALEYFFGDNFYPKPVATLSYLILNECGGIWFLEHKDNDSRPSYRMIRDFLERNPDLRLKVLELELPKG